MTENVNKKKKSTYYLALIFRPDPGDTTVASLNGIKPYRGPTASLPYIATDSLFALPLMDNTQYRHRLVTVAARLQSWLAQAAALRREREWERALAAGEIIATAADSVGGGRCVGCESTEVTMLFLPCRHLITCHRCVMFRHCHAHFLAVHRQF